MSEPTPPEPKDLDDEIIQCWCGAKGTYAELFDDSGKENGCGGTGIVRCECGGDFCVCHHHGEVECYGCEDCDRGEDGDSDDGDDWPEDTEAFKECFDDE